jgi:hypothetical protein
MNKARKMALPERERQFGCRFAGLVVVVVMV